MLIEDFTKNALRAFSIDTMLLEVDTVLWLRIAGSNSPFDTTGHYPILAGFSQRGEPIYVAAAKVHHTYYFTCVEDGASAMTRWERSIKQESFSLSLFVTIVTPPYPRTPTGAMDPTGPLHWLKFWPERDPDYAALTDSAWNDDIHLKSLLNSFSRVANTGGNSC